VSRLLAHRPGDELSALVHGNLARNEEHGASTQIDADGVGEDGRDARALEGVDATRRLPGQIDAGPFHGREDTAVCSA